MDFASLRVGIAGLGQIGGSIAARLSANGRAAGVTGYDLNPELSALMRARGFLTGSTRSVTELIEASDLVVVALPVGEIISILLQHGERLKKKVAVTDTGSVKGAVMHLAAELGLTNFVGGHPLAGTEKRGADAWNPALFENANYFLATPGDQDPHALDTVTRFVMSLGAHPVWVDPDRHDRIFAVTSNLPHVFAYTLARMFSEIPNEGTTRTLFQGASFRSATRVTGSDPEMVFQLLWHNRENLSTELKKLLKLLTESDEALMSNDEQRFRKVLGL